MKVYVAFGLALSVLVGVSVIAYWNLMKVGIRTHNREIQLLVEVVTSTVKDAESGQRGFLLTNRKSYLDPYDRADKKLKDALTNLRDMLADLKDPQQLEDLGSLEFLIRHKMELLSEGIKLRRIKGFDAALDLILTDRGKTIMEQIEALADLMKKRQEIFVQARLEARELSIRQGTYAIIGGTTLATLLIFLAIFLLNRDARRRRSAEENLTQFFSVSLDLLCITRVDGYFDRINSSFEQTLGFSAAELYSKPFKEFVHFEDRAKTDTVVADLLKGKSIRGFESRFICKDGTYKRISWNSIPVGKVHFSAGRDITELNKAEAERQLDADRRSSIIDLQYEIAAGGTDIDRLMNLVVARVEKLTKAKGAIIEMAEGDDMIYRAASGSAVESLGLRLKRANSLSGQCVSTGEVLICKDSFTDPRVDRVACEKIGLRSMVVVPLIHDQKVAGVLKVYSSVVDAFTENDISTLELMSGYLGVMLGRAESAEALKKSQQTSDEASRLKSEFLANMSHEIRTPINGVMGMANLLLDRQTDEETREYALGILNSAETLLTLVNEILDLSKAEAGKMTLENIDFDIAQLIDDVEKTLSFGAKKKGLSLSQSSGDGPRFFRGDPTRLRQILVNLVNNAIKFTDVGFVKISVQSQTIQDGRYKVRFEVQDTGIGIPDSALGRMFQVFSQVDASTTRRFGGTGLGLSISKRLVHLMGGEIGVNSSEGKGSTFWFTVTLESSSGEKGIIAKTFHVTKPSEKKLKILLAEDNSVNQLIAVKMLQKMGHSVIAVGNGNEVIDALRITSYDLILMDCQMPVMDGYETTKIIRTSSSLKCQNVKIIAMTANAMAGDREKCLATGMNDYISKPVKSIDLQNCIESIFANEKIAS